MVKWLKLLNILMAFAAISFLSLMVKDYLIYKYNPRPQSVINNTGRYKRSTVPNLLAYRNILQSAVFPSAFNDLTPLDLSAIDEKKATGLAVSKDLLLIGTVVGLGGYAIFEKKEAGEEEMFKVGDGVFGAGVLKDVGKENAILLQDGREMIFKVPSERAYNLPSRVSRRSKRSRRGFTKRTTPSSLSKKVGEGEWVIDREAVLQAVDDMGQILSDARLIPNIVGGKVQGFRISQIKRRGIFDAIGLKNGDILVGVNGYKIDGPEKAVQVLSGLKGEREVNIDLIRRGRKMSFRYQMR